ncbi:MAG: hypothetical protein ACYC5M_08870 [Anaerolineae bacterium]
MTPFRNKETTAAKWALLVALTGLLMVALPGLLSLDGMRGGYALSFVGVFVALSGLVVALIFRKRAGQLERIIEQAEYLAHWRCEPVEWRCFVAEEYERQMAANRAMWLLVAGVSAVVSLVFVLADREHGWIVLAVLVGLLALLAGVAYLVPSLTRARNQGRPGEVWLAKTGVVLNGSFTSWAVFGARLEATSWHAGPGAYVQFDISYPSRYGRQTSSVRAPVPSGHEEEACQALHALAQRQSDRQATLSTGTTG